MRKQLKPGYMIVWRDRHGIKTPAYGFLVRRFDSYVKNKIASRNYSPSWAWEIIFTPEAPYNYNSEYGCSEMNLLNGAYGTIYTHDGDVV